jgi:AraC family transcriptional activator of tynA and feaB
MVILLNTDDLAPPDRPAALEAIFDANEVPQRVRYVAAPAAVKHRLEVFRYGPNVHMRRNVGTGLIIERLRRHVAASAPEQLALFYQQRGLGNLVRDGVRQVHRAGSVGVIDTIRPYSWRSGRMNHFVMLLDNPELGLTPEQLLRAGDRLVASPLYAVARSHFAELCASADDLHSEAMVALGRATAQLLRATVMSTAGGAATARSLDETLFVRMVAYVDEHLHDPQLSLDQIAADHYISVRHLHNVWVRETGQSPAGWIMGRRFERAATLLAEKNRAVLPIGSVARQCGFASVSHFSRRFKAVHDLTPSQWSQQHQQG